MSAARTPAQQILDYLNAADLDHLAALKRTRGPRRPRLTDEGVERLAEILAAGSKPTVGFYMRHRVAPDAPAGPDGSPPLTDADCPALVKSSEPFRHLEVRNGSLGGT